MNKTKKKAQLTTTTSDYPVVKEGWLSKVGGLHRAWRQRYCVVRGGFLEYYVDKGAWNERREPKGVVLLYDAKLDELSEAISGKQFAFSIRPIEENRCYMFVCANQADENSWKDSILTEIARLGRESGTSELVHVERSTREEPQETETVEVEDHISSHILHWVQGHITSKRDLANLFRALTKQLPKITSSSSEMRGCACPCQCCSCAKEREGGDDWKLVNSFQVLEEVVKVLDHGSKVSTLAKYVQQPAVSQQLGFAPAKGLGHSASSFQNFDALMPDNWEAPKKKKKSKRGDGPFAELLRMVGRGPTEERSTRHQVEYHEIVPEQLTIGHTLGSGATGVVYAGTYFDQAVAVKKLHPHIAVEVSAIEEFIQEAEIWKPLTFRNVLQLYGVCADPGNVCMVMEIGAMSLSDLLYKEVRYPDLSWSRRLNIARDISSGCCYLHSKNIVHRDIKTMNILLSQEGIVKICDFGMSKTLGEIEEEFESPEPAADPVLGTPQWLAPEVAEGAPYSKAADVFSFGIVMWEIASRRLPYTTTPKLEDAATSLLLTEIGRGVRPNPHSMQPSTVPQVHERYLALMMRCWAASPDMRPPFEEIVAELSEILDLEERRDRSKEHEAQLLLKKGEEHFKKREYDQAIATLKQSLQCAPDVTAYMTYWLCCMSGKHADEALVVCGNWIKDFPFCTAAYVKKGDTYMYQQKFTEALGAYKEGQSQDPYDTAIKNKIKDCQKQQTFAEIDMDPTVVHAKKQVHRATLQRPNVPPPRHMPRPGSSSDANHQLNVNHPKIGLKTGGDWKHPSGPLSPTPRFREEPKLPVAPVGAPAGRVAAAAKTLDEGRRAPPPLPVTSVPVLRTTAPPTTTASTATTTTKTSELRAGMKSAPPNPHANPPRPLGEIVKVANDPRASTTHSEQPARKTDIKASGYIRSS